MRFLLALLVSSLATGAAQARDEIPYYGPMQGLLGQGYKHETTKDGAWRIVAEYRTRDPMVAMDVALYRAAELAREAGMPYVEVLGGSARSSWHVATALVFARGSRQPTPPTDCLDKRCYTADVGKVLQDLSGLDGDTPGVASPSSTDKYGRAVTMHGYGIGAVSWAERKGGKRLFSR